MKNIIAILVIFSLILAGCSRANDTSNNSNGDGKNVHTKAEDTIENSYDDMDVKIVDTLTEPMELPSRSLGNATFNVDNSGSASLNYLADGKESSVTITDSSGMAWTLTLSKDALLDEKEIKITPLTDIHINTLPGAKFYGLMMEPDELEFLSNATITISKSGEELKGTVLMAAHDGSEVVLSQAEVSDDGIKATVAHFSTLYFLPSSDPASNKLVQAAQEEYDAAAEAAKALLKKPLEIPAPPSISLECLNDKKVAKAKEYCKLVTQEEFEIITRLLSADSTISTNAGTDGDFSIVSRLLQRSLAKVNKLISTYSPQPEKILAVFHTAMFVWKNATYYVEVPEIATFLDWAQNTREYYLNRLVKEHEYKSFGAAMELDKLCSLMGGSKQFDEIINAMTFKLSINTIAIIPGSELAINGDGILKSSVSFLGDKTIFIQGIGTLEQKYIGTGYDCRVMPESFPVKMQVRNWNPCESETIDILIESIGSDDEEWVNTGYHSDGTSFEYSDELYPWTNDLAEFLFEKEIVNAPFTHPDGSVESIEMIDFNVTLRNGQATAAVETIEKQQYEHKLTIHIQLEHTP